MPSRPMLTTPARSAHRPPRPARPIGTAAWSAARTAPLEVRSFAPVTARTARAARSPPAMISSRIGRLDPALRLRRRRAGRGVAASSQPAVVRVMPSTSLGGRSRRRRRRPRGLADPALLGPACRCRPATSYATTTASTVMPCMIVTISCGISFEVEDLRRPVQERPQQRGERDADGWLRPSSAIAMPVKPSPPTRSVYACVSPEQFAACRPGRRPRRRAASRTTTMRLALTPLATAADGFMPVARRSKPNRVRLEHEPVRRRRPGPRRRRTRRPRCWCRGSAGCPEIQASSGRIGVVTVVAARGLHPEVLGR